jgi:hypothetical protein
LPGLQSKTEEEIGNIKDRLDALISEMKTDRGNKDGDEIKQHELPVPQQLVGTKQVSHD